MLIIGKMDNHTLSQTVYTVTQSDSSHSQTVRQSESQKIRQEDSHAEKPTSLKILVLSDTGELKICKTNLSSNFCH